MGNKRDFERYKKVAQIRDSRDYNTTTKWSDAKQDKVMATLQALHRFTDTAPHPMQCKLWIGKLGTGGLPLAWIDGNPSYAAKAAWQLEKGRSWPAGSTISHSCGNILCVNARHVIPICATDPAK